MAYASWSVVFGEQPSAAKWNILGTNDSSFNDGTGIANLEIGSGHTSLKNDYKFYAYRNASQNTGSAFAVLQCDTKIFDTSTNLDIVTNKGRFTAPVSGFYFFSGQVIATLTNANDFIVCALFKNGSDALEGSLVRAGGAATLIAAGMSGMLQLTAGDFVEFEHKASNTVALVVGSAVDNYFQGFLISQT